MMETWKFCARSIYEDGVNTTRQKPQLAAEIRIKNNGSCITRRMRFPEMNSSSTYLVRILGPLEYEAKFPKIGARPTRLR